MSLCNSGNFENEEVSQLYEEILTDLKTLLKSVFKDNNEEPIRKINSEFLLDMFEIFKDSSHKAIETLITENISLKKELHSIKKKSSLIEKELSKIVSLFNINETEIAEQKQIGEERILIESSKACMPPSLNSTAFTGAGNVLYNRSYHGNQNLRIKINSEEMRENLNLIRSHVVEMSSKYRMKILYIEKLKDKLKRIQEENCMNDRCSFITFWNNKPQDYSFIKGDKSELDKTKWSMTIPRWIPDVVANECKSCLLQFSLFNRKHHCRKCGEVFCYNCCNKFESFFPYYTKKVRMCEDCFNQK